LALLVGRRHKNHVGIVGGDSTEGFYPVSCSSCTNATSIILATANPEWFDILVPVYPGCPGILAVKQEQVLLLLLLYRTYRNSLGIDLVVAL